MKIKEVLQLTGLTDRAVRLYIENGLVAPENQKSYTGRNSYDFSDTDVKVLQQIALLRKADFSIGQIKALQAGGEAAQETLSEYLDAKKETLTTGQNIVSALEALPPGQALTLEDICNAIAAGLREKALPPEDIQPTAAERWEKWLMRLASLPFLVIHGLFSVGVCMHYAEKFPFHKFYLSPINYFGVLYMVIPLVSAAAVFFLYRKPQFNQKKKRRRRNAAIILLFLALLVAIEPKGMGFINYIPPVYSETDNPTNYLVLGTDTRAYGDSIHTLFPATIPNSAIAKDSRWFPPDKFPETTKYHYYFQDFIDPSFDIYAEWVLPEEEYDAELQRIYTYYPDGPKEQVQWGDWTCMSFTDWALLEDAADTRHYYYLIFACNPQTNSVRYIASYAMDTGGNEHPYFLSLEW